MFPNSCERSPARRTLRVLVVDDERLMRWALRSRLEQVGYRVTEAGDGSSALRAMRAGDGPDALVLDYRLPDMDGFEVMRQAALLRPACRVIMMTAHAAPEHEAAARALGATAYFAKPFDASELVATLGGAAD